MSCWGNQEWHCSPNRQYRWRPLGLGAAVARRNMLRSIGHHGIRRCDLTMIKVTNGGGQSSFPVRGRQAGVEPSIGHAVNVTPSEACRR